MTFQVRNRSQAPSIIYVKMSFVRHALIVLLLIGASCGKSLEKQVQDGVRTFDTAEFSKKQVKVDDIKYMGNHAVATVTLKTAVKMIKQDDQWVIDEVRIGDRRWEKAEFIIAVLNEKRTARTRSDLNTLSSGISQYRSQHSKLPPAKNFKELVDALAPDYLGQVTRLDAWSNPFSYRAISVSEYDLRSAGPDGKVDTADDLTPGDL